MEGKREENLDERRSETHKAIFKGLEFEILNMVNNFQSSVDNPILILQVVRWGTDISSAAKKKTHHVCTFYEW